MNRIEFLNQNVEFAKDYKKQAIESIKRNDHMNKLSKDEIVSQKVVDAVLVDFINFCGQKYGIDYGIYTVDLDK